MQADQPRRPSIANTSGVAEQLQLLEAALEAAANPILISMRDGTIIWVNEAFERLSGYASDEALGQNARLLKSGRQSDDFYKNMWETILSGRKWRGELVNRRKDGSLYPEEMTITPVRNAAGDISHFIASKLDTTERKRTEDQLAVAQKIQAVGRLPGEFAYKINSIFWSILFHSELASEGLLADDRRGRELEQIKNACHRGASLTQQELEFSHKTSLQRQVLNLNVLLTDYGEWLQRVIKDDVRVKIILEPVLGLINAVPAQMNQVLLSLVLNSRRAMPGRGKITIETANTILEAKYCRSYPSVQPGQYVLLSVSDTGHGMDAEAQATILAPFFTSKEPGPGTGLDLQAVYEIVRQAGGIVGVQSELGKGTTFKIYFPRVDQPIESV